MIRELKLDDEVIDFAFKHYSNKTNKANKTNDEYIIKFILNCDEIKEKFEKMLLPLDISKYL